MADDSLDIGAEDAEVEVLAVVLVVLLVPASLLLPQAPSRTSPAAVAATINPRFLDMGVAFRSVEGTLARTSGWEPWVGDCRWVELGGAGDYWTVKAVES